MCQIRLDVELLKKPLTSSEIKTKTCIKRNRKPVTCQNEHRKHRSLQRNRRQKIQSEEMSVIPEQHLPDPNAAFINRNMTLYHAGKFNETPKSSVSTDTEVYTINFNTIHAPYYSMDDSMASDNDGYDTEKHVRVIRQVSSDTYCSDNCFYSDSETNTKYPDVINHDNTTSNILYEMCDTLNKVPDILSGNVENSHTQIELPCRLSETSSSSFYSDDRSPNWSPNSTLQFKQWPDNETVVNDMTDTDSIIYHNVDENQPVADNVSFSSYDNVSKHSYNFLNSTIDLFNTKQNTFKETPIMHDNIKVEDDQIVQYPENLSPSQSPSVESPIKFRNTRNVNGMKSGETSKKLINLDVLNKLDLNQMDQDIDHEISNLLETDCLNKNNKVSDKYESRNNNSQFYEYNPRHSNDCKISKSQYPRRINKIEQPNTVTHLVPNNNNFSDYLYGDSHKKDCDVSMRNENFHQGRDFLNKATSNDNEYSPTPKKRKKSNETLKIQSMDFHKENVKLYDLSESCSAPNIYDTNKKQRYSTSSIDEGSDYDPEISFHKISKSISNVNIHEYGKKFLRTNFFKNRSSREELEKIERTVENMLEQVILQENLLEKDVNYMPMILTQRERKALPLLSNLYASADEISDNLEDVPIHCNRKPLMCKYQTKHNLNLASSSNVSSACSIEDLERSVNKLLSDVEQEESKLISSQDLGEYHQRYKIGTPSLEKKLFKLENYRNEFDRSQKENSLGQREPITSQYFNSTSSNLDDPIDIKTDQYNTNDEEVWWEGAYQFGLREDDGGYRKKIKRSNKRAAFWPNNPYGLDRQISYTPSSEEGLSSSSNSESESIVIEQDKKKAAINLRVKPLRNGKCGIEIGTTELPRNRQIQSSNYSLNSLWNKSMPSLPSCSSESSFPSALSIRSSGSEDCLSNLGYYQNLVIPSSSIEYITPAELGISNTLINSGYCHWNYSNDEGKQ